MPPHIKNTSSSTNKRSSQAGAGGGGAQLFNRLYIQNGISYAPRTFTIRLNASDTMRYEVIIFG